MTKLHTSTLLMLFAGSALAQTPWERFLALPSAENASAVEVVEYSAGLPSDPAEASAQKEWDVDLLNAQILAQVPEAVDLGFRLELNGHLSEKLHIALGRLIRSNPKLFLTYLHKHREKYRSIRGLVGNFGEEYVDRETAQDFEADQRIKALKSVRDSELVGVRDECIELLAPSTPN